jgi:DNA helicase-2/ATP-dependent DNA helicase PcrA
MANFLIPAARREEENLFYVAATRARARLTLLSPAEAAQRSSFIAQLRLPKSSAAAEAALERNQRAPAAAPPPATT